MVATPNTITATPGAAGTLDNATYAFRLVAVDFAGGTSTGGSEVTCVTVAGAGAGSCSLSWSAVVGAVSYRVYGSAVGAEDRYFTTTALTYVWTTATGATVTALPSSNTAYRLNIGGTADWLSRALSLEWPNIAVTATTALTLENPTLTTAAIPVQQSPDLQLRSHVWNTTATAADNTNDWKLRSTPASGTTPSGLLQFVSSLNGAAETVPMSVASTGTILLANGAYLRWSSGSRFRSFVSTAQFVFTDTNDANGFGLDGATASIMKVRNTAQNADGGVTAAYYNTSASSVLTISSNVIAPTGSVHHVGAGLIKTITVPALCTPVCSIDIIPDVAFTYDATGNIVVPVGGGTALINKTMRFTWDGSKWAPSY